MECQTAGAGARELQLVLMVEDCGNENKRTALPRREEGGGAHLSASDGRERAAGAMRQVEYKMVSSQTEAHPCLRGSVAAHRGCARQRRGRARLTHGRPRQAAGTAQRLFAARPRLRAAANGCSLNRGQGRGQDRPRGRAFSRKSSVVRLR